MEFPKESGARRVQVHQQSCFLVCLLPPLVHTHTVNVRAKMGSFLWVKAPQVSKLDPPLKLQDIFVCYLSAILLGRSKTPTGRQTRRKHEALRMPEFTSYSELASCTSSREKQFKASDKKKIIIIKEALLLAFWIPSGAEGEVGKVSNLLKTLSNGSLQRMVCMLSCAFHKESSA